MPPKRKVAAKPSPKAEAAKPKVTPVKEPEEEKDSEEVTEEAEEEADAEVAMDTSTTVNGAEDEEEVEDEEEETVEDAAEDATEKTADTTDETAKAKEKKEREEKEKKRRETAGRFFVPSLNEHQVERKKYYAARTVVMGPATLADLSNEHLFEYIQKTDHFSVSFNRDAEVADFFGCLELQFATVEEAEECTKTLTDLEIREGLSIKHTYPKDNKYENAFDIRRYGEPHLGYKDKLGTRTMVVIGVDDTVTEADIREQLPKATTVYTPYSFSEEKKKGYMYVEFPSSKDVDEVSGKPITIRDVKYKTNRPEYIMPVKQLVSRVDKEPLNRPPSGFQESLPESKKVLLRSLLRACNHYTDADYIDDDTKKEMKKRSKLIRTRLNADGKKTRGRPGAGRGRGRGDTEKTEVKPGANQTGNKRKGQTSPAVSQDKRPRYDSTSAGRGAGSRSAGRGASTARGASTSRPASTGGRLASTGRGGRGARTVGNYRSGSTNMGYGVRQSASMGGRMGMGSGMGYNMGGSGLMGSMPNMGNNLMGGGMDMGMGGGYRDQGSAQTATAVNLLMGLSNILKKQDPEPMGMGGYDRGSGGGYYEDSRDTGRGYSGGRTTSGGYSGGGRDAYSSQSTNYNRSSYGDGGQRSSNSYGTSKASGYNSSYGNQRTGSGYSNNYSQQGASSRW